MHINLKYIGIFSCIFLCGCSKLGMDPSGTNGNISARCVDFAKIEITENPDSHFFELSPGSFNFTEESKQRLESVLKIAQAKGMSNVSFLMISDKPIPLDAQKQIKENILAPMFEYGFMESRILDSGTCIYPKAIPGVRINILDYEIDTPDIGEWTDTIGDADPNKHLPKIGVCHNYNLEQMIANKADLLSPRRYKGQRTQDAIDALSSSGGSSGGGSGGSKGGSSSSKSSSSSSSSSSGSSSSK